MTLINPQSQQVKPFLRWAGGKSWLLKHFSTIAPEINFNDYYEPFLGGAALYFHLEPSRESFLSDLNSELIHTYQAVQDDVESVIRELRKFRNTEEDYYAVRNQKFRNDYRRAAQFIYLNQTSFNGIYRVNLNGKYNVPFGYRTKDFFEPENLRLVSEKISKTNFEVNDFENVRNKLKKNDLIFLDPPYTVTHNNNGFVKYNQKIFSIEDQYRLSELIDNIKEADAYYILSNAAHQTIEEIFEKGDNKYHFNRASLVGGLKAKRGQYSEVIFTNLNSIK